MKIAFNPSTVAALTSPPNNKDITFDLKGHSIYARGVEFKGTDTWRPVVDNLTSDSTTSSLSANQGRVLAGLINGKSDSDHNHDDRYLKLTGGVLKGQIILPDIDVNTSYTGSIIIGSSNTENLGIDGNEIMARNNGKASTLYLNNEGGAVQLGAILRTNSNIVYMGGQSTRDMIKFINNTSDSTGNGIAIGGGGLTIIGSGESSDVVMGQHSSGGDENMIIAGDGNIDFYSNLQNGWKYGKHMYLDTNGFLFTPSYINIGGNENNNSSPDRVWGSNSGDSFLRSYRTSALKVAYANSAGNANSANHATNADKLDGYHYNSFAPFNGVKFIHRPGDTTWHRILQFTTDWIGQVTFMYSPEECQRDYWGIFNINIRSKDIWFRGFSFANVPQIKCIGDDNNNWSVWVKGNTGSYDPYGVIQVLNYSNASIINVGLDKSQTTEPSGTYNRTPELFYAGFADWNNITNKPSSFTPSAHEHNYVLDIGNNAHTTFAYSKSGLSKDSITWLAVWNGYELRAMNKNQIALSGHTHTWTSITDKIVAGNEFNIVNAGFKDNLWLNFLPINDRSKSATIDFYHLGNGHKGYATLIASGFLKNGSSDSYVLLGGGGHKAESALNVANANTVGGYHYNDFTYKKYIGYNRNGPYNMKVFSMDISSITWVSGHLIFDIFSSGYSNNRVYFGRYEVSLGHWNDTDKNPTVYSRWIFKTNSAYDCVHVVKDLSSYKVDVYIENSLLDCNMGLSIVASSGFNMISSSPWVNLPSASSNIQIVSTTYLSFMGNASSATKVIVNQHTTNDTNYPLVWSNQPNTSNVTENQLYKSWADLYYNPKNKRLTVGGSVVTSSFIKNGGNKNQLLRADGGVAAFNWSGQAGQPTWLWGGNDFNSYYVYNPSNFNVNTAQYLRSLGNQKCQTGRTQNYGDVYTYNTCDSNTGSPTTYTSVIGFGRGIDGTVEIAGGWCDTNLYWRSLRDCCEDWHSWRTVLDSNNYTDFIGNYYWANVKISASSSTTTSPTVSNLTATSSINVMSILLGHGNEINSDTGLHLNYRTSGSIGLCNGGGNVCIGAFTVSSYKLDVRGTVRSTGFYHASHSNDDAVLLAGGGYKILNKLIFVDSYNYHATNKYNLIFHKLSGICNNLVWVDGHVYKSTSTSFAISRNVFPYRYDNDPDLKTICTMGADYISVDAVGVVRIVCNNSHRVGFFYTGIA